MASHPKNHPINPFFDMFYHINTPKYNPQQCIYTYGFFIPLDNHEIGNIVGSRSI
jgi:hypothetical protein